MHPRTTDLTDMPYEALLELEQSLSEGSKRDDVVAEIKRREPENHVYYGEPER